MKRDQKIIPLELCKKRQADKISKNNPYWKQLDQTLALWEQYKQYYKISDGLLNQLCDLDLDEQPYEILDQLPFPCVYISWDEEIDSMGIDGFFVYKSACWNFIPVTKTYAYLPVSVHPAKTVDEGILVTGNTKPSPGMLDITKLFINLVLYVIAQNAEYRIVQQPKPVERARYQYKELGVRSYGESVTKPLQTVRYGSLGRITNPSSAYGTGKRAHARKGHWHHYWTGSKSDPESRKLVLRWVAPTLINAKEGKKISQTTIIKVKQPE